MSTPRPHPALVRSVLEALGEIDETVAYLERNEAEAIHLGLGLELEERAIVGSADDPDVAALNQRTWGDRFQAMTAGAAALGRIAVEGENLLLDDGEVLGLKVVLSITARPAILVIGDRLIEPPRRWRSLLEIPTSLARVVAGVGWIRGGGAPVGTGFMVGDELVMTNAHVARSIAPGDTATIAFSDRFDDAAPRFELRRLEKHPEVDLAISRVAATPISGSGALPAALPIAAAPPPTLAGREVYAVGFPRTPHGTFMSPELRDRIFARVYDVKRVQPGALRELDGLALRHDCSTLGGNSGSPLIDLEEGDLVVGLHYNGSELERNLAVPLWLLADDPMLRDLAWES